MAEEKYLSEDEKRAIRVHERQELKKLERQKKHRNELLDKVTKDEDVGKFHIPFQLVVLEYLLIFSALSFFMGIMWGFMQGHNGITTKLVGYGGLTAGLCFFALINLKKNIVEGARINKEKEEILKAIREEYY